MSAESDKQIAEILANYGEPLAGNIWRVQGTAVIYHKALERIAAQAQIAFGPPQILRAERDEAVILVTGEVQLANDGGVRREWSIGEALIGVNYRVSGKQAAYVFAMAEKRAKDRVILKLIGLHGLLYSEDEADEFKPTPDTRQQTRQDAGKPAPEAGKPREHDPANDDSPQAVEARLRERIDAADSINAVTDLMLAPETQADLAYLAPGLRDEVREHAKARLVALGWPARTPKSRGGRS
ncbi:trna delta -isopentenylpyrophosphate transferase [Methylobacterium currus]|uniref:Trna delta-isopentenylpyrophosphate transferase n=1 Tax=Methylobacterium currus TaxID=2051553 RepID=A0A2R4WI54_9HYPH|nr:trna delta -isopentenylpyrophosphate transferase [Methylobacterium currus]AWB21206.1 trna delta -isopentenylpyrophosphate transferase [Methylobacterium currus]